MQVGGVELENNIIEGKTRVVVNENGSIGIGGTSIPKSLLSLFKKWFISEICV